MNRRSELNLEFFFKSGSYDVKEQYIIYDADSMFADIGGYMGLLLGDRSLKMFSRCNAYTTLNICSILSVVTLIVGWIRRREIAAYITKWKAGK